MRKLIYGILVFVVAAGTARWAAAQNEEYEVLNTGGQKITIDADLGDWALLKEDQWVHPDKFTEFGGGKWNGPDDHSVWFALLWDQDGLYLAFDVTDDEHLNTELGDRIWNGDSVQIFIEPTGERNVAGGPGVAYEYNFGLGGANSDKPQFSRAFAPAQANPDIRAEYAFRRDEAAKKTYYEVRLTEADIAPALLEAGTKMGFSMIVNDGDKGPDQAGQKGWTGWGENAIVFGKDATQTNLIILSDTPLAVEPAGKAAVYWGRLKQER